jgi:hypothetical protein
MSSSQLPSCIQPSPSISVPASSVTQTNRGPQKRYLPEAYPPAPFPTPTSAPLNHNRQRSEPTAPALPPNGGPIRAKPANPLASTPSTKGAHQRTGSLLLRGYATGIRTDREYCFLKPAVDEATTRGGAATSATFAGARKDVFLHLGGVQSGRMPLQASWIGLLEALIGPS